jgi:23S rRNA (adenine2503-C2)-methyltransferase
MIQGWQVLSSGEDESVNFVRPAPDGGAIECRYVRRCDAYAIAYLSSHTGCAHACRFCHLTQTRQTTFTPVDTAGLLEQLDRVLAHAATQRPMDRFHVNFMARGEALSNRHLVEAFGAFAGPATARVRSVLGVDPVFNISSIFPQDGDLDLVGAFSGWPVTFFWSLYSLDPGFRKRWMPKARKPLDTAAALRAWQEATGRPVVLHWAFIAGQNDDPEEVRALGDWVVEQGLDARFNLVRYNPFSDAQGREPDERRLEELFDGLLPSMRVPGSRVVPRVGFDVAASCGMFVS